MAELKKYVLLDRMDATAPIFNVTKAGQKIRINKIPTYRPYLQITFTDKDGKNRTIRYKGSSNTIYQDEQIKNGILANERFSTTERNDLVFKQGLLATTKPLAQAYLDAYPANEAFEGQCDDVKPEFKLLNELAEAKMNNEELRRRAKAATKIFSLDLEEAKSMMIRLNGSHTLTPDDVIECQNQLIDFLDETNDVGIDEILKEDIDLNIDVKTNILISKLINADILSFDKVEGKISKKDKTGKWVAIRETSNEYPFDERVKLFSDFLNAEGKELKTNLEKELASFITKTEKKEKKQD